MIDAPRMILILTILLLLCCIVTLMYYFFFRRDVLLSGKNSAMVYSIIVLAVLIVFCVSMIIVFLQGISSPRLSNMALFSACLLLLMSAWNIIQMESVKKRSMETLETLVSILEVENANLGGHALHVHNLTMLLYDYLPFSMRWKINRVNLSYASLLIDLGKLGVPSRILGKTGKLLSDEWAIMKKHPEISARIFAPISGFDTIRDWILYHHERMDGNGYYRIKGEEIPLASRVITVADTYSSIIMVRSFKPTLSYGDAIMELKLAAGPQLDPEIVEIFAKIPKNRIDACLEDVRDRMARFQADGFRADQTDEAKGEG